MWFIVRGKVFFKRERERDDTVESAFGINGASISGLPLRYYVTQPLSHFMNHS